MSIESATIVDVARANLSVFSEYAWDQPFPNKWFHNEWYKSIQDVNNDKAMWVAPRNSAKTTCVAKIAPLWFLGRDHNIKILLLSRTGTKARSNLRFLRQNIEMNERVQEVFPDLKPSAPWSDEEITVINTRFDGEVSVKATGLGGSITGMRADLIIVDDLVDKSNVMTESQREKVIEYWNEVVYPIVNPGGRIFVICTRWSNRDFYSWLMEREGFKNNINVLPAFLEDENGHRILEDGEPISYWPERWPVKALNAIKADIGNLSFSCQYLNQPSGYEGLLLKSNWLTYYDPNVAIPNHLGDLDFYMAVDPNVSENPDADNTAIVTIAVDRRLRDIYVLDIYAKPMELVDQIKKIKEFGRRLQIPFIPKEEAKISKIGVEAVAFQRVLSRSLYSEGLPVVEINHNKASKLERIISLQPHFENGRIKFPNPDIEATNWLDDFLEEYVSFPRGRYDDRLDALEMVIKVSNVISGGSSIPFGPGSDDWRHLL